MLSLPRFLGQDYTPCMTSFVALLRGINVGGNKKVPMADLKKVFEKAGFKNVRTILNTGNVIFDGSSAKEAAVATMLEEAFGFPIPVLIRTMADIEALIASDPFKGITVKPETRLYVTFLKDKPTSALKIPYVSPEKFFTILKKSPTEVISVLTVTADRGSVDAMGIIEKEFGKSVTTRNWNTVLKLAKP